MCSNVYSCQAISNHTSLLTPIHKKGSPFSTDNYRGISVTSCLAKVFSMVMNQRLITFCIKHSLIDERQASHKKGVRTSDNVFILRTLFDKYCTQKKGKLYACFVDFRKAFDSIWHEALFLKLLRKNIGGPFYRVIKSMYDQTCTALKIDGNLTERFHVYSGVRQGDILSPILFNIFIDDIVKEFNNLECSPPSLIEETVGSLLYADDLVILSTTAEGLQNSIDKLSSYCTRWKMQINMNKTKTMCFQKTGNHSKLKIKYNATVLEQVKNYPYLGIEVCSNGSFNQAELNMTAKAKKALFKIQGLLYRSNIKPNLSLRI